MVVGVGVWASAWMWMVTTASPSSFYVHPVALGGGFLFPRGVPFVSLTLECVGSSPGAGATRFTFVAGAPLGAAVLPLQCRHPYFFPRCSSFFPVPSPHLVCQSPSCPSISVSVPGCVVVTVGQIGV